MKLTQKAIEAARTSKRIRARLALALDKSEFTIHRYLDNNDDNLTKAAALMVIREETGMKDSDILEGAETIKAA